MLMKGSNVIATETSVFLHFQKTKTIHFLRELLYKFSLRNVIKKIIKICFQLSLKEIIM